MYGEKNFCSGTPPRSPGSYRVRDANGDIIYWGESENLFDTWCKKIRSLSFMENATFEYALENPIKTIHI
jgi:excinuclease UvrABC nuclease subunit